MRMELDVHGLLLRPGEGETVFDEARRTLRILVDREELTTTWFRYAPGEKGPDPHIHRRHTDAFYVLEGELDPERPAADLGTRHRLRPRLRRRPAPARRPGRLLLRPGRRGGVHARGRRRPLRRGDVGLGASRDHARLPEPRARPGAAAEPPHARRRLRGRRQRRLAPMTSS